MNKLQQAAEHLIAADQEYIVADAAAKGACERFAETRRIVLAAEAAFRDTVGSRADLVVIARAFLAALREAQTDTVARVAPAKVGTPIAWDTDYDKP